MATAVSCSVVITGSRLARCDRAAPAESLGAGHEESPAFFSRAGRRTIWEIRGKLAQARYAVLSRRRVKRTLHACAGHHGARPYISDAAQASGDRVKDDCFHHA